MAIPWAALPVLPVLLLLLSYLAVSISVSDVKEKSARIPMWTDVGLGFGGPEDWEDIDYKLSYLMDTYDIVSLEKCLFEGNNDQNTEGHFLEVTSRMHSLRPESQTKVLYYWAFTAVRCYESVERLLERPEMWLRDSTGSPVMAGPFNIPQWDFRIEEARQMWIDGALGPVTESAGGAGGVFLDGTGWRAGQLAGCHYKTCGESQDVCCQFSEEDELDYMTGLGQAVVKLGEGVHALDPSNLMIGNGLFNYDFNGGHGNPDYDLFVNLLDGFCMEHLMVFEAVNGGAASAPFIKVEALENLIQLRERLVQAGKYLLVRAYPGPLGQPLDAIGGLATPHLPVHHPYPQFTTNLEVQQALKDLLNFPLAVYLCAFQDEKVYLSYGMWYSIRQAVPCPTNPEDCQWPVDFPELLSLQPGPASPADWEGRVCTRWFQGFGVTVDLEDETSGSFLTLPRTTNYTSNNN